MRTAEKQRSSENRAQAVPAREFTIIYEDDALLVIDKPAGVAVHGGSGVSFGVIEQIRRARPEARYLELVHRLDKDTSGLLMIAKKRSALVKLHEAIRNDHPKKIYLALGVGKLPNDSFHVKLPLFKYTGAQGEKMVRVSEDGQSAHTIFRVLNRFSDDLLHQVGLSQLTLVQATLKTGRTHQIRVHLQSQQCPIAGDERYGDYQANKRLQKLGLKRMFLHAAELHLDHPLTGEKLILKAPLPQDLAQFVLMLETRGRSSETVAWALPTKMSVKIKTVSDCQTEDVVGKPTLQLKNFPYFSQRRHVTARSENEMPTVPPKTPKRV